MIEARGAAAEPAKAGTGDADAAEFRKAMETAPDTGTLGGKQVTVDEAAARTAAKGITHLGSDGNDTIKATADQDKIFGFKGDDIVKGGAGNDELRGNLGDDVLKGGRGNDLLRGGQGNDTGVLDGKRSDYTVQMSDKGFPQFVHKGTGETDTFQNVENVRFTDQTGPGADGNFAMKDLLAEQGLGDGSASGHPEGGWVALPLEVEAIPVLPGVDVPELPAEEPMVVLPPEFVELPPPSLPAPEASPEQAAQTPPQTRPQPAPGPAPAPQSPRPPRVSAPSDPTNTVNGTFRGDVLTGTEFGDHMRGLMGNDKLIGGAGDDVFVGGSGSDLLIGGSGIDRAIQFGPASDYTKSVNSDGSVTLYNSVTGSRDTLVGIEYVTFADGTYDVSKM